MEKKKEKRKKERKKKRKKQRKKERRKERRPVLDGEVSFHDKKLYLSFAAASRGETNEGGNDGGDDDSGVGVDEGGGCDARYQF